MKTCVFRFHRWLSFLIRFLQLATQRFAAPAGGCFHLSLYSTEMAERSSRCDPDTHADTYAYRDPTAAPDSAASPDPAASLKGRFAKVDRPAAAGRFDQATAEGTNISPESFRGILANA